MTSKPVSGTRPPLVWIVILNWNGRQWLDTCLSSVLRLDYPKYQVLLVDNGSTDGSVEFARERFPSIHILENEDNLGFAEGNNRGIRLALDNGADMVLVLNNDTQVDSNLLKELEEASRREGAAVVGASVFDMESGRLQESGMTCDLFGFPISLDANLDSKNPRECFYVSGSCMLLTREFLEDGGLFDVQYFIFAEDLDLCWRAWLLGYRVLVAPRATAWHRGGGTVSGGHERGEVYVTLSNRIYLRERNTLRTILKNYSSITLSVLGILYATALLLEMVVWSWKSRSATEALIRAVGWNAKYLGDTLCLRRHLQSVRRRSDRDIMSQMRFVLAKWIKLQRVRSIRVLNPDEPIV